MSEQILAPQPPAWLLNLKPYFKPEHTIQIKNGKGAVIWESNPGPQTWVLHCPYDEVLLGGSRGGGKSAAISPWFAMGDDALPEDDPAHWSYLNCPEFRGLILREQYQDLKEFVDQAMDFFRHFNCKPKDDPVVFEFKSGAKIYTNHLNNEEAYNKYRGWNITKIAIEELVQIPKQSQYITLLGSLRSVVRTYRGKRYPKLRTQLLSTTNPDGPGASFVKPRFIDLYGGGKPIPWNTPVRDTVTGLTRIFIPARLKDNPYLSDDRRYLGMLLAQDPVKQAQWIEGDWNAGSGTYFRDYRPNGPIRDEPEWARHVIESADLKPWYFRWGGGDWGYDHPAAFHKLCYNQQDKRIHVYDELNVRQMGSYELGTMLARWWLPELQNLPDHSVTLHISPDAFAKRDETRTLAEQMAAGIQEILGPGGALLLRYNDEERTLQLKDPKAAAAMFEWRKRQSGAGPRIALKPAYRDRVAGASCLRDLLRWRPLNIETKPDMEHAKALFEHRGLAVYEQYMASFQGQKQEVLPKLLLWKACREADRCLRSMVRDPDHPEDVMKVDAEDGKGGDDHYESLRYGCMAFKEIQTTMPKSYYVAERMAEAQQMTAAGEPLYADPAVLAQIERFQGARYDKAHAGMSAGVTLPRAGASLHRRVN